MVSVELFGTYQNELVELITLQNRQGMIVKCATLGCTITEIIVEDRAGNFENVVCGFPTAEQYEKHPQFFGAAIGPFAGRLEQAIVEIDGERIETIANEGAHLLHGGNDGFHVQKWSYETGETSSTQFVRFYLTRKYDNFPGNIQMSITYTLNDQNELIIDYEGLTDEKTLLSVTNHSYFNLSGNVKRPILHHELDLEAKKVLYIDEQGVPMSNWIRIEDSPFQFNHTIQHIIEQQHEQIIRASRGVDHPFLLAKKQIVLKEQLSGRKLTITTDQPCAVIYTGQKIGEGFRFSEAMAQNYSGICIEVQNVPNSVVHKHFPSALLTPQEVYKQTTSYHFSIIGES